MCIALEDVCFHVSCLRVPSINLLEVWRSLHWNVLIVDACLKMIVPEVVMSKILVMNHELVTLTPILGDLYIFLKRWLSF